MIKITSPCEQFNEILIICYKLYSFRFRFVLILFTSIIAFTKFEYLTLKKENINVLIQQNKKKHVKSIIRLSIKVATNT